VKPLKTLPTSWLVGLAMHVLLCLFISLGEALGCQTDRSQMVALEVLPLWVVVMAVLGSPLVVLVGLAWVKLPWGNQSRTSEGKTRDQNE
jgi:hypothetical protein